MCVCVGFIMCVPLPAGAPSNSMAVWLVLPFRPWTAVVVVLSGSFFLIPSVVFGVDPSGSGLRALAVPVVVVA